MSKSKNHYKNETELAGGVVTIYLVVLLAVAYVVFKVSFFIVLTFCKFYRIKWLWITLGSVVALSAAGVILFKVFAVVAFLLPIPLGIVALLITCLAVQLNCRETLLRENVNIFQDMLGTSWWSSDSTPRNGVEHEQSLAA